MTKLMVSICFGITFGLLGCTTVPIDNLSLPLTTVEISPLAEFSTSPSPTLSGTIPIQTVTRPPIIKESPTPIYRYQSLAIEPTIPEDYKIKGILVMDGVEEDFLMDLEKLSMISLPVAMKESQTTLGDWTWPVVSSDRNWLAYMQIYGNPPTYQLQVIAASGHQYPILNWQPEWVNIIGWLDTERLTLAKPFDEDGKIAVFNPFTSEWAEIVPSFPNNSLNGDLLGGGWSAPYAPFIIYDTTLTRAVYLRFSQEHGVDTYELWDVQSESIVWDVSAQLFAYRPIWAPDGKRFAVVYSTFQEQSNFGDDDGTASLYIIEHDGFENKLIDHVVGSQTWSPDGRYIATSLKEPIEFTNWEYGAALAIIDVFSKETTVFSVVNSSLYPIWSPDGRYIAINEVLVVGDIPSETKTRVIIVDLVENRAFEIIHDVRVRGWMISNDQ